MASRGVIPARRARPGGTTGTITFAAAMVGASSAAMVASGTATFAGAMVSGNAAAAAVYVQQRPIENFNTVATPSTFYKQFAAHFKAGDVPTGKVVEWRKSDGTTVLSSQADNRKLHASDSSLKSCAVTLAYSASLAAQGGADSDTLKGYAVNGSWNNSNWTTTAAVTNRDIRAEVVIGGVTYTLGANNEIGRGNFELKRSGQLNAMYKLHGLFRNGTASGSTDEGDLHGVMYLTFYADSTFKADVRIYSSRGDKFTAGAKVVTSYALKDYSGPTTLFSYATAFTFFCGDWVDCCDTDGKPYYSGTSVDKTIIAFPDPVLADSTTTGLYDSGMMWNYKISAAAIAALPAASGALTYIPQTMAQITTPVDGVGQNWWIGPESQKTIAALIRKDYASFREHRINALADGAFGYWFLDSVTGYPLNMNGPSGSNTYPGLTQGTLTDWSSAGAHTGLIVRSGGAVANASRDTSHAAQWPWYQYVATGEEKWLDQMHGGGICGVLGSVVTVLTGNTGTRNPTINSVVYYASLGQNQARAHAWYTRNLVNALKVTPTTHVMYQYLVDLLAATLNAHDARLTSPYYYEATGNTLGVYLTSESGGLSFISMWMRDFWTIALSDGIRNGLISASRRLITQHIIKCAIGRMVDGCLSSIIYEMSTGSNLVGNNPWGKGGPDAAPVAGASYAYPAAWNEVNAGNIGNTHMSLTTTASTASGGTVITFASTTGIVDGMAVHSPFNASAFYHVQSHTATTITLDHASTLTINSGQVIQFFYWTNAVTNYSGAGCPISGIYGPYTSIIAGAAPAMEYYNFNYAAIAHGAAVAAAAAGLTGASTIVTHLDIAAAAASAFNKDNFMAAQPQFFLRPIT